VPPLSVNFFPLTFWAKKSAASSENFLDFHQLRGGGYPPFPRSEQNMAIIANEKFSESVFKNFGT